MSVLAKNTLKRLRDLGHDLKESSHVGSEYVDSSGKTWDQMGNPNASDYWDGEAFTDSIDSHLLKSNDYTAVDMTGFDDDQKAYVTDYINSLPANQQAKIVKVGF